jgi:hypothetical protein
MRYLVLLIFLSFCDFCYGREVTDTLRSTKNDRVIITYDVTLDNGHVQVKFKKVSKSLGASHRDEYNELDKVAVIFFDRYGNYKNYKFTGINIDAILRIPSNLKYVESSEGYHILRHDQMPIISAEFRSGENQDCTLEIPIYLAYYKRTGLIRKKSIYDVFAQCGVLKVKVSKRNSVSDVQNTGRSESQTITSSTVIEGEMQEDDNEALGLANSVMSLLRLQTKLPFDDELKSNFSNLNRLSHKVKDDRVRSRVEEAIEAYREKQKELEMVEEAKKEEADRLIMEEKEKERARQDSIAEAQKIETEKQQKRNLWMIIGGVILAVALFVGNQLAQTLRNKRTEKNMHDLARQAEEKAKRQARQRIQTKINKAEYEAKRKSRELVNDGIKSMRNGKNKNNNKGVSI